jgi:biotin synthase
MGQDDCTGTGGELRGRIGGTVVDDDDVGEVSLNLAHQRFDGGGLVEARDDCTAVPAPIHGTESMRNGVDASRVGVEGAEDWVCRMREGRLYFRGVSSPDYLNAETLRLEGVAQRELHERAAWARKVSFGSEVFVRGVVEISNFCRENCAYCGMRRSNRSLNRYRAQVEEIAELLIEHRPRTMTDVSLQGGEDPVAAREIALPLVRLLRRETSLGIILCLGTLDAGLYRELKEAGASIYIMKFEAGDALLYERLEAPGTLSERLSHIRSLASKGWFVSSGFIAGLPGDAEARYLGNFRMAGQLPLRGCSVSPFIPGSQTPLSESAVAGIDLTLNSMAMLRLMRPGWAIPAVSALNLAGPGDGYRRGLRVGANLVTINLTPPAFREDYVLYKRDRYIMTEERILGAIQAEGLRPSPRSLVAYYTETSAREEVETARSADYVLNHEN